jgi:hypothetical protein
MLISNSILWLKETWTGKTLILYKKKPPHDLGRTGPPQKTKQTLKGTTNWGWINHKMTCLKSNEEKHMCQAGRLSTSLPKIKKGMGGYRYPAW